MTTDFGSRVLHEASADGSLHSVVIEGSKGNILDERMCQALLAKLAELAEDPGGKLLVLSGACDNFSYGASVQEHFPDKAPAMLRNMREVITRLCTFPYPTLAAVEGKCLGGGLEVALACGMVFVDEEAVLAFPEIRLGSFAPFGSVLLAERAPRAITEELLLSGREIGATEALRWGLVNRVVSHGKMEEAVVEFAGRRILPHSAASLRVATKALRGSPARNGGAPAHDLEARLAAMEQLYLQELVPLEDAKEGIRAFLEKRYPGWHNR